jgi:non-canonical (house-cleaning) NTP pyrophosphatase
LQCAVDFDIACGIEFGYEPIDNHLHCIAYACIIDKNGNQWLEHSSSFKLPPLFEKALGQGKEMSDEMRHFDKIKPETNLARAIHSFMRKDDMLIQAYHSVFCAYLGDQLIFNS